MDAIPLTKVDAKIFEKIIEYCEHQGTPRPLLNGEIGEWDSEFLKLDQNTLFDLVLAANYLNIENLFDVTTQFIANMMKNNTPSQIRARFGVSNKHSSAEDRSDNWS
ncbi:Skp1_POZ domain-containing protein [Caenorhabditis elegans]|uniref:Skp1_POZ domain-containing protein n=1 Tax=Caenorhabditis elegans TaxID=6239 RepID=Q9U2N1_CAEEL|nr:Skp1_POZ domain-containing protein [Caenorhabditis elegans]CAB63347.2 Skp1_POZ domain-containing protein [Caenorhabditis elegans]|eukprot:NP_507574.2 SKp1 Related (ubiquitin ligase complex component) [Caenorhabditis elegans]